MVKILRSFLINAIYIFNNIISFFSHKYDFTVVNRQIEYHVNHDVEYETDDPFWENERSEIDPDTEYYIAPLDMDAKIPKPPDAVDEIIIRVKYWYKNKVYKYMTYNVDYEWPPKKTKRMSFHIPLVNAQLVDSRGEPVRDILEKIRRYAGPYSDFYGENVKISHMFYFDRNVLKHVFPKIKIKNCIGGVKVVDTCEGVITDLQLP